MLHDTTSRGRHVDDIKATLGDMRATRGDIIRKLYPVKWTHEIATDPNCGHVKLRKTKEVDTNVANQR